MGYQPDVMLYHAHCADGFGAAWAAWMKARPSPKMEDSMTDTKKVAEIAEGLTEAQRKLVIASEPGGFGMHDRSIGVEIRGSQYRSAKVLERLGIGFYSHGDSYGDLYFNTDDLGLAVRSHITGE